jgi:hypothetical protein
MKPLKEVPHHLTEEEIANPWLVFDNLFDEVSLAYFRTMLWKSFLCTVMGTYPNDTTSEEREEIVYVYEQLKKVIDAIYVLNQPVMEEEDECPKEEQEAAA